MIKREAGGDTARIQWLYELLYSRPTAAGELELGLRAVREGDRAVAWQRYCQVLLCANEFVYVD
jgi:hypothetical protein